MNAALVLKVPGQFCSSYVQVSSVVRKLGYLLYFGCEIISNKSYYFIN